MEELETAALNAVSDVVEDGSVFFLVGVPRDVVILHLMRRAGKNRVRLINPQFPPIVSQRSFFIEKLRRLWGLGILEENFPKLESAYSEEEKLQKILGSFKGHRGRILLLSSQGDEFSSVGEGIILIRPLCKFSDADALEYVRKYKLPVCSVDMEGAGLARDKARTGPELSDRLKDLGYL